MKKNIVVIAGPTASGKTAVGIEIAKRLKGEIISADSMQIYKYMDIGSAKPTREEMQGIPHHMIDVVYPDEEFSVALFRKMAGKLVDEIINRKHIPIIVGGTGLYISSLIYPYNFTDTAEDTEYREALTSIALEKGNEFVHNMLKNIDIESFIRIHPNNLRRVIRALEVYKNTGKTISEYQQESRSQEMEYNTAYIGLTMDRGLLYNRINRRVDKMFEAGLIDEVKKLREMGYNKNMTSMQGIGYKEIFDYFDNKCTIEETKDIIKQSSRRYAKRQLTWFRRDEKIYWVEVDRFESFNEIIHNITNYIEGNLKLL
jgi:tRNA dimethylallyltransferase